MIIDTSVVIAILFSEPERDVLIDAIYANESRIMSSASVLESFMVLTKKFGSSTSRDLQEFLEEGKVEIEPFEKKQLQEAQYAFTKYGRGRHPAALNFGDCIVYGLAKETGEPLLCKGTDFAKTDIELVSY